MDNKAKPPPQKTFKTFLNSRIQGLTLERSSWIDHYRELSDYIQPRRGRFLISDTNKGDKKNSKIIDGTASEAVTILSAGLMSGLTNPSRPWYRLGVSDLDLMDYGPVKKWLEIVETRMSMIFSQSNLYNSLPTVYEELGIFGTGPMMIEEDPKDLLLTSTFTAGEYSVSLNDRLEVDLFQRDFRATVHQCVAWFGYDNCSTAVKNCYDRGSYDDWVDLYHMVDPNDGRYDLRLVNDRPYRGMYWEKSQNDDKFLEVRGFHEFPVVCPRWHVTSADIYGRSLGMSSLGDIKMLQLMQKRKLEGLDKWVRPPMKGPPALRTEKASILPGDLTFVDESNNRQGFTPVFQVNPDISAITEDIRLVQQRVMRMFHADLFLMLANSDRRQITAREIEERHEEKLLMLGPVLQRLNDELLDPLIERTFNMMVRASQGAWKLMERGMPAPPPLIPPPPEEIADMPLEVEYISILQQAQKSVSTAGVDRLLSVVTNLYAAWPEVIDKIDIDEAVDKYADMLGTPVAIVRSDEKVKEIREQRAEAQQAQQSAVMAEQAAAGAKTLSESKTGNNRSLLNEVIDQIGA